MQFTASLQVDEIATLHAAIAYRHRIRLSHTALPRRHNKRQAFMGGLASLSVRAVENAEGRQAYVPERSIRDRRSTCPAQK